MNNEIARYNEETFESIKHVNEYGNEFWYARELQRVLEYTQWRRFADAIERAKLACSNSGYSASEHFADVGKSSPMPHGGVRILEDYMLSRYACYLIVMNGDPRKEVIAVGQTYFAVKTHQQELIDHYDELSEDQKRLAIRKEMKAHNKSLAEAAQKAGVINSYDFAIFQNYGYQGLYGGLGAKEIHARKGLRENEQILDHMGSTDEKLRRENIRGKEKANQTHCEVGRKVRQTIAELGGTMPEDLPTPEKSIRQIESEQKKRINGK